MNRIRNNFGISVVVISMVLGVVGLADAQRRNGRDIRDAVRSLNSKIEDFESNLRYQMQSSSVNNSQISYVTDDIRSLRDSVRRFEDNYDRKRENREDVNRIIVSARRVDQFLQSNRQIRRVEDDWAGVRRQIDRLGTNYGVTANWTSGEDEAQYVKDYPPSSNQPKTQSAGLSGTYDLDLARSENVDDIVTDTRLGTPQRDDLKEKLVAPQQIAIDIRDYQVTLATTNATPVTFTADGQDKSERSDSGKTVRLRATLNGDSLIVSSIGGETDYTITFTSVSDGRVMKVSRRITTDYLNQTVFAESVYNKTDAIARLGIKGGSNTGSTSTADDPDSGYSDNDRSGSVYNGGTSSRGNPPTAVQVRPGNYVVPDRTLITGILENDIDTKTSQNNDRFRMTVQSPDEFRGATVEGYISGINRSGKVTGQSKITFNFERIILRNGRSYDFAGSLQNIKDMNGDPVKVDNEGTAQGDDQTKESAKRGGIGAGIGAVIGAIAGGAKGAAIGAIIGAGGGAGSVAIQGRSDIRLMRGSTLTVEAAAPPQQQYPR
ncbi:MAG: hypothetical protein ABIV48_10260 [Pyrinomonadaceae bacterium]